jgi:DHA1 family inner membrane transport protein
MNSPSFLAQFLTRIEMWFVGPLDTEVRHNMIVDLRAACTHSVMATVITFVPIILRRSGASTEQVAYYFAITTLGLLTTNVSMWLMRRFGMRPIVLICWLLGRGAFLFTAVAFNATSLLVIFTIFWLFESWPTPAYVQTIQAIYPIEQRGRILAAVRAGLVALSLVLTPLAGWVLDQWGYRVLLPFAGLSGIGSTLIFFNLMRKTSDSSLMPKQSSISPLEILRGDAPMRFYLIGLFLFGLGLLMSSPLFPIIQVDRLNLSYSAIGLLGFVQSLFWFLGYMFGGHIVDRLGGFRSLQIVFALNAIAILPYIWATQSWMLLPSFVATGLVTAGADLTILYTISQLAGPEKTPSYAALNSMVAGLRGLLGPVFATFLISVGWQYGAVLALSAGLTLAGAWIVSFSARSQLVVSRER